jgi:S1-C subfamily serine protease
MHMLAPLMNRTGAALAGSWVLTLMALGLGGTTLYLYEQQAVEIERLRAEQLRRRPEPSSSDPRPAVAPVAAPPVAQPLPQVDLSAADMADVVERALPAVVSITAELSRGEGSGSGVVVDATSGLVVTNAHVVRGAHEITVTLSDGRDLRATLVGVDPPTDIALLRMPGASGLTAMAYGDSAQLRLGDVVLAIGNPFDVGQTVTMGIVSATGRSDMRIAEFEDFIQTDAAINPGNSGGALVSTRGELVGINAAILSRSGGSHGIGFAIPSNMVRPIVESLLRHGRVVRGWLGVSIQDLTTDLATALSLPAQRGVIVSAVEPGSPAAGAGVQAGDLIEQLDGERVLSRGQLSALVATRGAGAAVNLALVRSGERQTLAVTLGQRPEAPIAQQTIPQPGRGMPPTPFGMPPGVGPQSPFGLPPEPPPARPDLRGVDVAGMTVVDLDARVRGVFGIAPDVRAGAVVADVRPGSPGANAGLAPGDVVVELNRAPISSAAQLAHGYATAGGNAVVRYRRGMGSVYVVIP